ncbi:MAG: PEGA domain-containing protein [Myxococcales bacterium]|nr:PEGA domain-containing protein [Myxococcales bacterium]
MRQHLALPLVVAALALSSVASGQTGEVAPPTPEAVATASAHFERGVRLFEEGDPKLALVEFRRSYEAVPDFRTLYNIGQVELKLGAFAAARRTLERYLAEGGERVPEARREAAKKNLEALQLRTAHLTLRVAVEGAEVTLDGARLGATPLERTMVSSGIHTLSVAKAGFRTTTQDVSLVGGEDRTVALVLEPLPKTAETPRPVEPRGPSTIVWITWATAGLFAAGTLGMTFAWQSADSDLDATKRRLTTREELDEKKSAVETRMGVAIALGAATLAASGVAVYFTLGKGAGANKASASLTPLGIGGRF